jgi:hypothetical protein
MADAGAHAEPLVNATAGVASADALTAAGVGGRDGIVVLDVSNPLTFTAAGPALAVANPDSSPRCCSARSPRRTWSSR